MKVHHLNCATMCPLGGRLLSGTGKLTTQAKLVCHVFLVETDAGLVLVDTGLGLADVADPSGRLGREFTALVRPRQDPSETAVRRVEALGFSPADVRHIVLTHLDLDHAGGLADFPSATVHLLADEHDAALHPQDALGTPALSSGALGPRTEMGLVPARRRALVRIRKRAPTRRSAAESCWCPWSVTRAGTPAVVVNDGSRWLLHAGDAYFHRGEMDPDRRRCPPLLDAFQRIVEIDGAARLKNQERLRALVRENSDKVRVFCAHDPVELDRCRERAEG